MGNRSEGRASGSSTPVRLLPLYRAAYYAIRGDQTAYWPKFTTNVAFRNAPFDRADSLKGENFQSS